MKDARTLSVTGESSSLACEHIPEPLVIQGVQHAFCGRCRALLGLHEVLKALAASERKLILAAATLSTVAMLPSWEGAAARECLSSIGREDLATAADPTRHRP